MTQQKLPKDQRGPRVEAAVDLVKHRSLGRNGTPWSFAPRRSDTQDHHRCSR